MTLRSSGFWPRYTWLALIAGIALTTFTPRLIALWGIPALLIFWRDRSAKPLALWALYCATFVLFAYLRSVADNYGPSPHWRYAAQVDTWLGFGILPSLRLQEAFYIAGDPQWWDWLGVGIYQTHYLCIPLAGLAVWRWRPESLRPFFLSACLAYGIGLVMHWLIPTTPPWLAALNGDISPLHRSTWDLILGITPEVYRQTVIALDQNQVAAMPSMHTAAATLVALVGWTGPAWVRWSTAAYAVLMLWTLVYFAEHWVIDGLVGAALIGLCWWWAKSRETHARPIA